MYDVLISKFNVCVLLTDIQFTILERTLVALFQLHLNSWAMIWGFEIIYNYLGVLPSPSAFFFFFTLTCPSGGDLTTSWLSFRAHINRKVFLLYEESFHRFKPVYFKVFKAPGITPFWETKDGELGINRYWYKDFEAPQIDEDNLMPEE